MIVVIRSGASAQLELSGWPDIWNRMGERVALPTGIRRAELRKRYLSALDKRTTALQIADYKKGTLLLCCAGFLPLQWREL